MASSIEKTKENLKINIRKFRKAKKLTQFELGVQTDVTEDYIQFLEAGIRNPSLEVLCKLADALNVEPYELLK